MLYSDKLRLSVVDLTKIDMATKEDKAYHIDYWASLFKATTWEEIKMLQRILWIKPREHGGETRRERRHIGFVVHDDERNAVFGKQTGKIFLGLGETVLGNKQNGHIQPLHIVESLFHTHLSQIVGLHLLVETRCIHKHALPYPKNLARFLDGVGGSAGRVRDNGNILTCKQIHQAALTLIALAENADIHFLFFHIAGFFKGFQTPNLRKLPMRGGIVIFAV